jgi:pimeloyl-ACP methyl ester carboxylesterase
MTMRSVLGALCASVCASAVLAAGSDGSASAAGNFVAVRGSQLYVETLGSGAPIVFLHGGVLYFDNNFARQRDYFAAFRQVVGIDRRGHGHSPDDGRPFSYQEMADDTAAVIEKLGLGPVDIVGHSDGADVALILAHDHPELVHRIVISGANLRPGLSAEQLEERSKWSAERVDEAVRKLNGQLPAYFRSDFEKTAPDGAARWWTFLAKSYRLWLTPVVIATADLKTIVAPVMVMAGDNDFTPLDETLEIYRGLPHAQLFILPGTGHGTMMDRPELVNPAMRRFFDEVQPPPAVKP